MARSARLLEQLRLPVQVLTDLLLMLSEALPSVLSVLLARNVLQLLMHLLIVLAASIRANTATLLVMTAQKAMNVVILPNHLLDVISVLLLLRELQPVSAAQLGSTALILKMILLSYVLMVTTLKLALLSALFALKVSNA